MKKNVCIILFAIFSMLLFFNLLSSTGGSERQVEAPAVSWGEKSALKEIITDVGRMPSACPNEIRFRENRDYYDEIAYWERANGGIPANKAKAGKAKQELFEEYKKLTDDCVKKNCPVKSSHLKYIREYENARIQLERTDRVIKNAEDKMRQWRL